MLIEGRKKKLKGFRVRPLTYACFAAVIAMAVPFSLESSQMTESASDVSCRAAMDSFLGGRLGDDALNDLRSLDLAEFYSSCSEWLKESSAEVSSIGDAITSGGIGSILDTDKIEERLVQLGFVSALPLGVVVMASEQRGKYLKETFFTSASKGFDSINDCEKFFSEALNSRGFSTRLPGQQQDRLVKMRSFATVVGRYKDPSSMPNFTAQRAAVIVSDDASAAVVCGAKVKSEGTDDEMKYKSCAKVRCKAVEAGSTSRIVGITDVFCHESYDQDSASSGAVRGVCKKAGHAVGSAMISHFAVGEGR